MNDDLLVKYLLKETGEDENLLVRSWVEADPANQKHFRELELIWERSRLISAESSVNTDEAWARFKMRTRGNKAKEAVVKRIFPMSIIRNIAASLLLLTGVWLLYSKLLHPKASFVTADSVITETLPDGSEITLNKNSSLSYSSAINAPTRSVELSRGEVFFRVKPNKSKPFVIQAGEANVKVVGTAFNVKRAANSTEVIVESGIVRVAEGGDTIELHKGQRVTVTRGKALKVETAEDDLYNYYITKQFKCNNTPLPRLIEVLNEAYGTGIVIQNPALRKVTINTTFRDESIERILDVIVNTSDVPIRVEKRNNQILLR